MIISTAELEKYFGKMCIRDRGAALEDIPPPLAGEIAQPGQTVKGEPPKTAVRCTLDGPLPAVLKLSLIHI